eukprot:scaffold495088_cov17-Prasinocladus_malaysianus.AAC.1
MHCRRIEYQYRYEYGTPEITIVYSRKSQTNANTSTDLSGNLIKPSSAGTVRVRWLRRREDEKIPSTRRQRITCRVEGK